jgi:hypothetical protein
VGEERHQLAKVLGALARFAGSGPAISRWLGLGPLTQIFQEEEMATIVIRDLSENVELDRKAMQAIEGGSRYRRQAGAVPAQQAREKRIVDFRAGPVRRPGTK